MSIRIITHCYAVEKPQYAVFLRAQLSSLLRYREFDGDKVTVCYTREDWRTAEVLVDMTQELGERLQPLPLAPGELFRRSIGRNIAAKQSSERFVWFADADYYFGPGCLESLERLISRDSTPALVWPSSVLIHRDHATGDAFWKSQLDARGQVHPPLSQFVPMTCSRAIGGIQIVPLYDALEFGYLDGQERWQTPVDKPFADFRDDIAFRKSIQRRGGEFRSIPIEGLYRLRHSP